MDTGVFGLDHPIALLPNGRTVPTWDIEAPGPLVTTVLRQLHNGAVYDIGTTTGHLALLAKSLVPGQPAAAGAAAPADVATIGTNALVNAANISIGDLSEPPRPAGDSPDHPACLAIIREPRHLPLARSCGGPRTILILGRSADNAPEITDLRTLRLDRAGNPAGDGPAAAVLLTRPDDVEATHRALAAAARALAERSAADPVSSVWANHAVDSALRLADILRQEEEERIESLKRQVDRALDQMSVARDECEAMRSSRSWRMTRFLRGLKRR